MQNKPNFRKSQMNVNLYNTTDYENIANWTLGENKPNSKPIQTQSNPICRMPEMGARLVFCASVPHDIAPELLPTAFSEL